MFGMGTSILFFLENLAIERRGIFLAPSLHGPNILGKHY